MKKLILVVIISTLSLNCFSQNDFEKGYFINNENEKIECYIKNLDWKNNPVDFEYKISSTSNPKKATIESVKEFSILNTHKYNRFNVQIDKSSDNFNRLDTISTPSFSEEQLFLKTLVEGKAILLEYEDKNIRRFFFNVDDSDVSQLIFKKYILPFERTIRINKGYKQQLWNKLKCQNVSLNDIENIDYNKKELVDFFLKFNGCHNSEVINFDQTNKKDAFNLSIRPGINSSSLSINMDDSNLGNVNFDNHISFRLGLEAEMIMPFNNNKWSFIIEPTYQYYNSEKNAQNQTVVADYKSIELPLGIRHYFFLNDNSKVFINGLYVFDFSLSSKIQFENREGLVLEEDKSLEIIGRGNLAVGGGFNINNRFNIEIRYSIPREIFNTYPNWNSKYKTISLIFGYSIF